jgi:hypothetical protein
MKANTTRKLKEVTKIVTVQSNQASEFITDFNDFTSKGELITAQLNDWLKAGIDTYIIEIAEHYKVSDKSKLATLKTLVAKVANKLELGISLQGLGSKQVAKIDKVKASKGGNKTKPVKNGDVLTVQYDNDSFDNDAFMALFESWDIASQQYLLKNLAKVAKVKKVA